MLQKHSNAVPVLVEPIYRRQPEEGDREHRFFLVYRDIPWEDRDLTYATSLITGKPATAPNTLLAEYSSRWQWEKRADAFDLYIQEGKSERSERLVKETKEEIEMLAYKLVKKLRRAQAILDSENCDPLELQKQILQLEAFLGKGNAGKWMLEAYKTLVGEKLNVTGKMHHLIWGS